MATATSSCSGCVAHHLRPEIRLLLACARTAPAPTAWSSLSAVVLTDFDWDFLLAFAARHRLTTLLHYNLRRLDEALIPDSVRMYLREEYQQSAYRNLLFQAELLLVLQHLELAGIAVATYKGPLLATSVYGNPALRTYEDLDIVIHQHDVWRARDVLLQHGYSPARAMFRDEELRYVQEHNDYPLRHAGRGVALELQWRVMQEPFTFPHDVKSWWKRFVPYTLSGRSVLSLPPEDLLLALCVHGSKHQWQRLNWIVDIAELLRVYPNVNWPWVQQEAARLGLRRMLGLGLVLARDVLGATVPAHAEFQPDSVTQQLAQQVCQRLFFPEMLATTSEEDAPLFFLRMHERWRDRIGIVGRLYPGFLRPVQVLRRYRHTLFRPLFNR